MPQLQKDRPTADDINTAYKQRYITAADRNKKMRLLAGDKLEEMIGEHGMAFSYFKQTAKHVADNWNDLIKLYEDYEPKDDIGGEVLQRLKLSGQVMWREVMILASPLMAFGEVNGKTAEHWALQAGATPGLAKVINVAVDVGSGFIPIGKLSKAFARGVQKAVPEGKALAAKAGGKGKAGAAEVPEIGDTARAEQVVDDAITRGLKADGVEVAEIGATKAIAEQSKELSSQGQFLKDLRAFKAEMANVTATKTHEMTAKEADKLGLTIEDLKGWLGEKVSEAEMYAYLKALDGPVQSMISNAKEGLAGNAVAGDAAIKTLQEFFEYSPKFRKAEVTAGRSVEILKETPPMKPITEMLRGWDPESMAKMDSDAAKKTILEDLVEMGNDTAKLKAQQIQAVPEIKDFTFWDKFRTTYISGLLLVPLTAAKNFIGNSYAAMNSVAERELAGWLSIDQVNGVVKGEGFAQFQGMQAAMAGGFKKWGEAFSKMSPDEANKFDFIPYRFEGPLGRVWQSGSDNLRGMDNFFKAILHNGDIYGQALNRGTHQGLEGKALYDYAARHTRLPSQSMIQHAQDFALNGTYQNDLGTMGKWAQGLLQYGPMSLLFPFMKTPMNLAKYSWNHTPGLQFLSNSLYQDILAGGTRADMAIARLTLSNMMGMFWYGLAQQGLLTGGGPVDPGLRRTWGKEPYAFAGKDAWWQPGQLDPATTSIWMMADFAEVMNQLDDPTAEQTAMAIGLAGVRDIVDKSYWQTVGQAVDFIGALRSGEEPGAQGKRLITGPLQNIQGGPLVARVARIVDPVRREARGFMQQVRSRVPGFSESMPPMRDGWGDPMVPPQPLGGGWAGLVSPLSAKGYETDPIKKEGSRLQTKIPLFPWSIGGKSLDDFDVRTALPGDPLPVDLSPKQRDRWQVIYREILRHPEKGIEPLLLNNPEYQVTPFAGQRNAYMNFLAVARAGAKDALMVEDTTLARKTTDATAGKYLPMLRPEMRPQVEAQISESLDLFESLAPQERANLEAFGIMGSGEDRDRMIIEDQITKPIKELNAATGAPQ